MFPETALVTGGASGIGAATVRLLEAEGARVESLGLENGFDVSRPEDWERVGPVDLAFLNAGVISSERDVATLSDGEYRRVVGANVDGVVFGVRRLARILEPGSAVVVTASLAGLMAVPGDPVYALTKHAVVGFVRSVAPQLAERGVTINCLCPGLVDTPMTASVREELAETGFPLIPPERVAETVLLAARSGETGKAWALQPGREPIDFRFPNVPGPRGAGQGQVPAL
ncbi:MAG TPA: SDR family oxidoreductase [Gaiellaceae bacterium]|nr:SDR family oxidoreductase [Gaiellaceae bacterium]